MVYIIVKDKKYEYVLIVDKLHIETYSDFFGIMKGSIFQDI